MARPQKQAKDEPPSNRNAEDGWSGPSPARRSPSWADGARGVTRPTCCSSRNPRPRARARTTTVRAGDAPPFPIPLPLIPAPFRLRMVCDAVERSPFKAQKKEPLRRAALERNRLDYLRRRKINSAAAPSPAKAMLVGSGTAITIPAGNTVFTATGNPGGKAVGSPVAGIVKIGLQPVGAP